MATLTNKNIDFIIEDVKRRKLVSGFLFDEFIDHFCCQVEIQMTGGTNFKTAYENSISQIKKKEINHSYQSFSFWLNYKSILTQGLLYLSLILYVLSWVIHTGPVDWLNGVSLMLLGLVILRFAIVFRSDQSLKNRSFYTMFTGSVFIFIMTGGFTRFISTNFLIPNIHYSAMIVFGLTILSILSVRYYKQMVKRNLNEKPNAVFRMIFIFSIIHLFLILIGMLSFLLKPLLLYIPYLAGIIVILDIVFFFTSIFLRKKGTYFFQVLVIGSFITLLTYFPFRSFAEQKQYNVIFRMDSEISDTKNAYYLYLNYFKYGKEKLTLYKIDDSTYQSKPVTFYAGGIDMTYKLLGDSLDLMEVLLNDNIPGKPLKFLYNDTIIFVNKTK